MNDTQTRPTYKNDIRKALAKIGHVFGGEYYNDTFNNKTTHRRFKFTLEGRKELTSAELAVFTEALQEAYPKFKVSANNFVSVHSMFGCKTQCVVVYFRWIH